jgi:hypothetical protein
MMPRRSARNENRIVEYSNFGSISLFPEGPPMDGIERILQDLNLQAFPSLSYARVDDILVHALFATKRRPFGYRALHPETAGGSTGLTDNDAMGISNIIVSEIQHGHPTKEECKAAAMAIWFKFDKFFLEEDLPIIEQ